MTKSSLTPDKNRTRSVAGALAAVAAALYLPFAWLLQLNFITNSYHFHWLCMWPLLPGLVVGLPFKRTFDDTGLYLGSSIGTTVLLMVLTFVGKRFRYGMPVAVAVALTISIPTSALAHWLFHA